MLHDSFPGAGPSTSASILTDERSLTPRPPSPSHGHEHHDRTPRTSPPGYAMSAKARGKTPVFQGSIDTARVISHDFAHDSVFSPSRAASGSSSSPNPGIASASNQSRRPSHEELLMHDARLKMSSQDQEAIRRLRSTLVDYSENSSPASSPLPTGPGMNSPGMGHRPIAGSAVSSPMTKKGSSERKRLAESGSADRLMVNGGGKESRTQKERGLWGRKTKSTTPLSASTLPQTQLPKSTEYIVAVVGHAQVGKSSFIRRSVQTYGSSMPVSVTIGNGHRLTSSFAIVPPSDKVKKPIRVEFVEMDIAALQPDSAASIWPRELPPVHGAVLCYDATRPDTLAHFELVLTRFTASAVPAVVLACKSDPDKVLAVDPADTDALCQAHHVGLIEVTGATPEGCSKMRNALRWLLFKLEQRARRAARPSLPLTETNAPASAPLPSTSAISRQRLHSLGSPIDSDASSGTDRLMWGRSPMRAPNGRNAGEDTQSSSGSLGWVMQPPRGENSASMEPANGPQPSLTPAAASESASIAADRTAETITNGDFEMEKPLPSVNPELPTLVTSDPLYLSLSALFNRLFTSIIASKRHAFVKAFFLTYRRFCRPDTLMQEFSKRMDEVDVSDAPKDVRMWALMRLTGALLDWTTRYPGDLATEACQIAFRDTVRSLSAHTYMAHLTTELAQTEKSLGTFADTDRSWALRKKGEEEPNASTVSLQVSETDVSLESHSVSLIEGESASSASAAGKVSRRSVLSSVDLKEGIPPTSVDLRQSTYVRRNRSNSGSRLLDQSTSSVDAEDATFAQWVSAHTYFLTTESRTIAIELTRLQWSVFSLVRARDVFRHVLGKELSDPCTACIDLFNKISRLVSTMILANPKAKHRARMYEKFLAISIHLRRLGNYDSLYAVVAGMQETSVRRLKQTHELAMIAEPLKREYEANLRLLDSGGGQAGYREAITADLQQGKSALPLMSSVLSLVAKLRSARPIDFNEAGDVHWDKFAKYAEIVNVVAECQTRGSDLEGTPDPGFQRIFNTVPVIMSEDELFQRSKLLEPSGGIEKDKSNQLRKLLGNLTVAP